ncbi:LLM class flavin-dependent oxidoreductase [Devosia sp.]|uniref:LLM class flavin-dependent oxidoreductase n=1 Tax=Devosia sp. TaxID=1871048 RepID=UPI002F0B1348
METSVKQLKLGVIMKGSGSHIAGWRHPSVDTSKVHSFAQYAEIARISEEAKMHFVFLADSPSMPYQFQPDMLRAIPQVYHLEPATLLSALAPMTNNIGLVGTISTTFSEPYNVARTIASLDHISGGRAGWNVVTTANEQAAGNFSSRPHPPKPDRYDRASEFVDIVKGLWDSWEDDAFVLDKQSGVFADPDRLHILNHRSERFSVRGPLNVPRSPQGHPVICVAAASEYGRELAARVGDMMFCAQTSLPEAAPFYADVKGRMSRFGRREEDLSILFGAMCVVGRTDREAREKYEYLESKIQVELGISYLSHLAATDLSGYPLDGPLPAILYELTDRSRLRLVVAEAERSGLSLRQTAIRFADGFGHLLMVGSPSTIADTMQAWLRGRAADGFVLRVPYVPEGLLDFTRLVVPELQGRGLFRTEYCGTSLRDNMGLPRVQHHAAGSRERAAL